jgi:hypothetical protein
MFAAIFSLAALSKNYAFSASPIAEKSLRTAEKSLKSILFRSTFLMKAIRSGQNPSPTGLTGRGYRLYSHTNTNHSSCP